MYSPSRIKVQRFHLILRAFRFDFYREFDFYLFCYTAPSLSIFFPDLLFIRLFCECIIVVVIFTTFCSELEMIFVERSSKILKTSFATRPTLDPLWLLFRNQGGTDAFLKAEVFICFLVFQKKFWKEFFFLNCLLFEHQ